MNTEVIHNTDQNRYEIWLDGEKVGHADYSRMPGEMHLVHTEVDPAHQGKQLAGILMQGLVDDVRATGGIKLVPVCSYTVMWLKRHEEQHDLLGVDIDEAVAACRLPKSGH
jgi:predicted GNAT family acetyltransferase